MKKSSSQLKVYGTSARGYNGTDDSGNEIEVPLVYDSRVRGYISKQAAIDLDDEETDRIRHRNTRREELFRKQIGIR